MSEKMKPDDPAYWMLSDEHTSTPTVHKEGCYICEDAEFAQMGLPLCYACKACGGHVPADDPVCSDCGVDSNLLYGLRREGKLHKSDVFPNPQKEMMDSRDGLFHAYTIDTDPASCGRCGQTMTFENVREFMEGLDPCPMRFCVYDEPFSLDNVFRVGGSGLRSAMGLPSVFELSIHYHDRMIRQSKLVELFEEKMGEVNRILGDAAVKFDEYRDLFESGLTTEQFLEGRKREFGPRPLAEVHRKMLEMSRAAKLNKQLRGKEG
jgi:hypothetical protein